MVFTDSIYEFWKNFEMSCISYLILFLDIPYVQNLPTLVLKKLEVQIGNFGNSTSHNFRIFNTNSLNRGRCRHAFFLMCILKIMFWMTPLKYSVGEKHNFLKYKSLNFVEMKIYSLSRPSCYSNFHKYQSTETLQIRIARKYFKMLLL